jgi:hypothetical protein
MISYCLDMMRDCCTLVKDWLGVLKKENSSSQPIIFKELSLIRIENLTFNVSNGTTFLELNPRFLEG